MTEKSDRKPVTDPGRAGNPFDSKSGYSGQEYHRDREAAELLRDPPGGKRAADQKVDEDANDPPEAGRRASFDPDTGDVHGSGAGAGGGNPGEDYDSDPVAGGG
ncbi:MAG TPA: hypothetical protein VLG14_00390 [Sphingomonas sp.]|nr:hypothetical protein [Sphingomonas sp.]